jgi:hypothetical protein
MKFRGPFKFFGKDVIGSYRRSDIKVHGLITTGATSISLLESTAPALTDLKEANVPFEHKTGKVESIEISIDNANFGPVDLSDAAVHAAYENMRNNAYVEIKHVEDVVAQVYLSSIIPRYDIFRAGGNVVAAFQTQPAQSKRKGVSRHSLTFEGLETIDLDDRRKLTLEIKWRNGTAAQGALNNHYVTAVISGKSIPPSDTRVVTDEMKKKAAERRASKKAA